MKVRLYEIDEKPSNFDFQIQRKDLEKLEQSLEFQSVICQATLSRSQDYVVLKGAYQVRIEATCGRCLSDVVIDLDETFSLDLIADDSRHLPDGDVEITLDSPETDFFQGDVILLDQYFEDQMILDLPLAVICSDDCKGLCNSCGINLNEEPCDCDKVNRDSPFAVLKDLKPDKD